MPLEAAFAAAGDIDADAAAAVVAAVVAVVPASQANSAQDDASFLLGFRFFPEIENVSDALDFELLF